VLYKLLIVDDEPMTLKFIKLIIEESDLPIYICDEGENGLEAIELAKKHQPEFLIIDIEMPLMDGLTAAQIIKDTLPNTKIYILTAYGYFSYAQKAIKVKVEDYLLKPLKVETLINILNHGINTSLVEELEQKEINNIRNQIEQLKPIVKKNLIKELLTKEKPDITEIQKFIPAFNWAKFQPLGLLSASIFKNADNQNCNNYDSFLTELDNEIGVELFTGLNNGQVVFLREYSKDIMGKIEEIINRWSKEYKLHCTVAISSITKDESICNSYKEAEEIRKTAVFWGLRGLYCKGDFYRLSFNLSKILEVQRDLYNLLTKENLPLSATYLKKLNSLMLTKHYWYADVLLYSKQVITILLSSLSAVVSANEQTNILLQYERRLQKIANFLELEQLFLEFTEDLASQIHSNIPNQTKQMVNWAIGYINQNYNKDLTLKVMADKLFVSTTYFSRIFKKYAGKGFVNYLQKVRIEQAQKLLLTGKYTVTEVSKRVGFKDPSYFSYVFKKEKNQIPINILKR